MRTPLARRFSPVPHDVPAEAGWTGPTLVPVLAASGGAGASTLCALLAGALAELSSGAGRGVSILDGASGQCSPWRDWIAPGLDTALGGEGSEALRVLTPSATGYPRPVALRAAAAVRGLEGVAIIAPRQPDTVAADLDLEASAAPFLASVLDLPLPRCAASAGWLRSHAGSILLAVSGTADGIAAGVRAVHGWDAHGLPPRLVRPVVIAAAPGPVSPRARARLALLDSHTQPVHVIPFDASIARRGLAEALAGGAVGAPTRLAVRRLAHALITPTVPTADRTGGIVR